MVDKKEIQEILNNSKFINTRLTLTTGLLFNLVENYLKYLLYQ